MSAQPLPSADTPNISNSSSALANLLEARIKWKNSRTRGSADEVRLRMQYRKCEWAYFDEQMRIDQENGQIIINVKHMSDDFMEMHITTLLQDYKKKHAKVKVVCDGHTKSYLETHSDVDVCVE